MDKFIIVIEADNKRASAAYEKGLRELDLIMPQLMLAARKIDEKEEKDRNEATNKAKERYEKYKADEAEYRSAMREWEKSFSFFRGDRPVPPKIDYCAYPFVEAYVSFHRHAKAIQSIRAELKDKSDLASLALGPFRMTEYQVKEMIKWEDGSRIEELKQKYLA